MPAHFPIAIQESQQLEVPLSLRAEGWRHGKPRNKWGLQEIWGLPHELCEEKKLERAKGFEPSPQPSQPVELQASTSSPHGMCTHGYAHRTSADPDFEAVAAAWPTLRPELKAAIRAIVDSSASAGRSPGKGTA